jgi:hypothetical protein
VLVGVAVWLGLFFVGESTHGAVGVVVAVVLVVLGMWLGYFVYMALTMEAVGATIWLIRRDGRGRRRSEAAHDVGDLRYLCLVSAPALLAALLLGFGFGYLGGGALWGLYTAVVTVGFILLGEFLAWRR